MTTRTLVVWCPDWPVVAAGAGPEDAVAVVFANRVVACSPAARVEGVRRGLRRREAQGRCPDLVLVAADPDRDARAFEPVAAAVATLSPRLEVLRPGTLALPTRGPSRYFGGDEALAGRAAALATEALDGRGSARSGVADGPFAALLAARAGPEATTVVPPGGSAAFLAPHPVATLELALDAEGGTTGRELAELLARLGVRTLGAVAALPAGAVLGRFGSLGARAARLTRGEDERPPDLRRPEPDLVVALELDPPAERVETAAFAARTLAAELGERLGRRGLACTAVAVEAETEHGEALSRRWRSEGGLSPAALADRVRWQLDGWLHGSAAARPTGGISLLRLVPDAVVPDEGRQLGFWGGATDADERAARGVARLQGLLGPDAVTVPSPSGGRSPGERGRRVPAHVVRLGAAAVAPSRAPAAGPWPGALPPPSPVVTHERPLPAAVVDAEGRPVGVTGRGLVSAEPQQVAVAGAPPAPVVAWAGPWPVDERWWDPASARRRARLQVVLPDGEAHLLGLEGGRWEVEATYD
jgi:protein ImuB